MHLIILITVNRVSAYHTVEMDSGQLTVTEMRILVTSVVHMNVDQIALSVITIPNLKVAVQRLLCVGRPETADRNPQYQISDNHYQVHRPYLTFLILHVVGFPFVDLLAALRNRNITSIL